MAHTGLLGQIWKDKSVSHPILLFGKVSQRIYLRKENDQNIENASLDIIFLQATKKFSKKVNFEFEKQINAFGEAFYYSTERNLNNAFIL